MQVASSCASAVANLGMRILPLRVVRQPEHKLYLWIQSTTFPSCCHALRNISDSYGMLGRHPDRLVSVLQPHQCRRQWLPPWCAVLDPGDWSFDLHAPARVPAVRSGLLPDSVTPPYERKLRVANEPHALHLFKRV